MLGYETKVKKDFNLLPKRLKSSRRMWKVLKIVFRVLFVIVGLCIATSFMLLLQVKDNYNKKTNIDNEIVKLRPVLALEQEYKNQKAKLAKIQNYYKIVTDKATPAYDFLRQFEMVIPEDVSVLSVNYADSGKLDINGMAKSQIAINDFTNNIRGTKRFSEVFLSSITKSAKAQGSTEKNAVYAFNVSCKFEPSKPDPSPKPTEKAKASPAANAKATPSPTAKGGKAQ